MTKPVLSKAQLEVLHKLIDVRALISSQEGIQSLPSMINPFSLTDTAKLTMMQCPFLVKLIEGNEQAVIQQMGVTQLITLYRTVKANLEDQADREVNNKVYELSLSELRRRALSYSKLQTLLRISRASYDITETMKFPQADLYFLTSTSGIDAGFKHVIGLRRQSDQDFKNGLATMLNKVKSTVFCVKNNRISSTYRAYAILVLVSLETTHFTLSDIMTFSSIHGPKTTVSMLAQVTKHISNDSGDVIPKSSIEFLRKAGVVPEKLMITISEESIDWLHKAYVLETISGNTNGIPGRFSANLTTIRPYITQD